MRNVLRKVLSREERLHCEVIVDGIVISDKAQRRLRGLLDRVGLHLRRQKELHSGATHESALALIIIEAPTDSALALERAGV